MKIGFFTDAYFPSIDGATYTVDEWSRRLRNRGHEVDIIHPESPDLEDEESGKPLGSVSNPFYEGYPVARPGNIFEKYDVVHCHSPGPIGISGLLNSKIHSTPCVYTHHTRLEEFIDYLGPVKRFKPVLGNLYRLIESGFVGRFDAVTASSDPKKRNWNVEKIPAGVDQQFFKPSERMEELEELERPLIGTSGRISREKNLREILELESDIPGTLVIGGDGPLKEELEQEYEEAEFLGWIEREKLPGFFSSLDVFVTASEGDTFCKTAFEAASCGTPVVAPDKKPFQTLLDSNTGLTYRKNLEKRLKDALEREFEPRKGSEKYSLERSADSLEELYDRL